MAKKMTQAEKDKKNFESAQAEFAKAKYPKPRITRPNKLYFTVSTPKNNEKKQHYWTLKATNGKIVGASSEGYSKKIYAIRNCVKLFGIEILKGTHPLHVIPDEERSTQVAAELVRMTNG